MLRSHLLLMFLFVFGAATAQSAVPGGADFMVGSWTAEGVCSRSETWERTAVGYTTTAGGRRFDGTVVIDGDFLTADLASRDGRTKHYRMQYINENRVRLVEAELCEPKLLMQDAARNLKCFHPRLQDVEFYMQRCAD